MDSACTRVEGEFLGLLCLQGLKETILNEPSDEEDTTKNPGAYAALIQLRHPILDVSACPTETILETLF